MVNTRLISAGALFGLFALVCAPRPSAGNAIAVSNVAISHAIKSSGTVDVQFDLSWSNSWRTEWTEGAAVATNWDAAWVFVKYRESAGEWKHAYLADAGHTAAAGCAIEVGSSGAGTNVGAFIYRSSNGSGTLTAPATRLRWNYAAAGLPITNVIDVSVYAIEMVYVAEGDFYVGDGSSSITQGQFEAGTSGTPFLITNEAYEISLGGGAAGSLGNNDATGMYTRDDFSDGTNKTLSADFPKGHAAFYCMKYEITQGQYTDFLNSLTRTQQAGHCGATTLNYYMSTVTGGSSTPQNFNYVKLIEDSGVPSPRVYSNTTPDVACNFLSWGDIASFADWAGLRPITELEFEKACRGFKAPVADEFPWGTTVRTEQTGHSGVRGSGTETATPAGANCCYTNKMNGPVRVGIFATGTSSRQAAGASYWGIMELGGNCVDFAVTVGKTSGRVFTGLHGDGAITAAGAADVPNWPLTNGVGMHGGDWLIGFEGMRLSSRRAICYWDGLRGNRNGGRAVRTAPQ